MNLIFNFPSNKNYVENKIAYFRAILIAKTIEDLNLKDEEKQKIKNKIIEKLHDTDNL